MYKKTYYFKAFGEDGKIIASRRAQQRKKRSFLRQMRLIKTKNWQKCYLKVSYGKGVDCWGKKTHFFNDCWCTNKEDLLNPLRIFDELIEDDFK